MPTNTAQKLAKEYLKKINLLDIADKRPIQCTDTQKLSIMLLRALMCNNKTIFVSNPIHLLNNLKDIKDIIADIKGVAEGKHIMILDILSNEIHYEGCSCHTIR
jgi:ABC-type polar amino acid transport system ATPase subunit